MNASVLILYSGGADSLLMMDMAVRVFSRVALLLVNYGQKHVDELEYARKQEPVRYSVDSGVGKSPIEEYDIDASRAFASTESALLRGKPNPYNPHHVPGRNLFLVSLALSIAETHGLETVWIGCDASDRANNFPDCKAEWVEAVNRVARINGFASLTVDAPLLGMTKEHVLAQLKSLGYDLSRVYSGYEPPIGSRAITS